MQKYHDEPKQYKGYLKSALASHAGSGLFPVYRALLDDDIAGGFQVTVADKVEPGFPFSLPRMVHLYTREPPSPRDCFRRTIVQVRRPSPQPALTCSGLEARAFRASLRHRSSRVSSLCQAGVLALDARQPAGTGSAQFRWSLASNQCRGK